jgi:hypothetical protein
VRLAQEWGSAVEAAHASADLGTWLVSRGRAEEAATHLAAARATYESLGAVQWLRALDEQTAASHA